MEYTDYGSNLGKNSSNSTGAYRGGPQMNYGSPSENRPVANGSSMRSSDGSSRANYNQNSSYFSADAFGKGGGSYGERQQPRSSAYGQNYARTESAPAQNETRRSDAGPYGAPARKDSIQYGGNPYRTAGKEADIYYSENYGSNGRSTEANGANPGGSRRKYTDYTTNGSNGANSGGGSGPSYSGGDGKAAYRSEGRSTNGPAYPPGNGKSNGSGNAGGGGSRPGGNGPKKPVNLTPKQKFVAWLKRFLRSIYKMGKPMRIFITSALGFVLVCVILIVAISGSKHKKADAMAAQLALAATPPPTIAPTETPVPTPSPTPEIRIEKGAEGEDVMALQKRLMELGYLAIDEPTSYFGNATKYAVKLFQRQHELKQDGICGNDTIVLLYSEEAKKYVMTEGAEGDDIESFQEQLVELGYLDDNQVTGYYGSDTVEAVKKFQNRNYITKDGKAGEQTLEEINSADARVSYTKEKEIEAEKKKQAALARASSPAGRIDKMISIAKKQLGDTYILGKSGPDNFDCSGLVYYCLRQVNVYTRRLNAAGLSKTSSWTKISDIDNVKAGDLLFFKSDDSSTIGHVGIYVGGGEMIDASSANGKVVRRGAKTNYWRRNFVVARRPIE